MCGLLNYPLSYPLPFQNVQPPPFCSGSWPHRLSVWARRYNSWAGFSRLVLLMASPGVTHGLQSSGALSRTATLTCLVVGVGWWVGIVSLEEVLCFPSDNLRGQEWKLLGFLHFGPGIPTSLYHILLAKARHIISTEARGLGNRFHLLKWGVAKNLCYF